MERSNPIKRFSEKLCVSKTIVNKSVNISKESTSLSKRSNSIEKSPYGLKSWKFERLKEENYLLTSQIHYFPYPKFEFNIRKHLEWVY